MTQLSFLHDHFELNFEELNFVRLNVITIYDRRGIMCAETEEIQQQFER